MLRTRSGEFFALNLPLTSDCFWSLDLPAARGMPRTAPPRIGAIERAKQLGTIPSYIGPMNRSDLIDELAARFGNLSKNDPDLAANLILKH